MRTTNLQRELILEMIEKYKKMLKEKNYKDFFKDTKCPFCLKYKEKEEIYRCTGCPNDKLYEILNLREFTCNYPFVCSKNAYYFGYDVLNKINTSCKHVQFRLKLWQDYLVLTKKEFVRKYKK